MPPDPLRHNAAARRVLDLTQEVRDHESDLDWAEHHRKATKIGQLRAQIAAKKAEIVKLTKYLKTGTLADLPAGFVATQPPGRVEPPTRFKLIP